MADEKHEKLGRILMMDDDEMIRFIAEHTLKKIGYEVECTATGPEAIEAYRKALDSGCRFKAVLLDLNIPGSIGGKETMRRLLELDPQAKGFVISGDPNDPVMLDSRAFGFYGALEKKSVYLKNELAFALAQVN